MFVSIAFVVLTLVLKAGSICKDAAIAAVILTTAESAPDIEGVSHMSARVIPAVNLLIADICDFQVSPKLKGSPQEALLDSETSKISE